VTDPVATLFYPDIDDTHMSNNTQAELLSLSFELWHPDCWALQVTDVADAELLAYGTLTDGQVARERYIVGGESAAALDQTVETIRESPLTTTVAELGATLHGPTIGSHTREIFVEFDAANSIDSSFVTRGFVYDGLPKMVDGHEEWSVLIHAPRRDVFETLDTIRAERDADITLQRIAGVESPARQSMDERERHLSPRQREALALARERGYYEWPRDVTAGELASDLGVAKTTFLEHLRKAEGRLLDPKGNDE
jgi:predicted DNA binding protein